MARFSPFDASLWYATAAPAHFFIDLIRGQQLTAGLDIGPPRGQCQTADLGAGLIVVHQGVAG